MFFWPHPVQEQPGGDHTSATAGIVCEQSMSRQLIFISQLTVQIFLSSILGSSILEPDLDLSVGEADTPSDVGLL